MFKGVMAASAVATLLAAQPAWADVSAVEGNIASDDALILQYVCAQDFHQCVADIPRSEIFSTPAYAQAHGDCCVSATYCDILAKDAVPEVCASDCEGEYGLGPGDDATYEPSYALDLTTYVGEECGTAQAEMAESRRTNRMSAWRGERRLTAPDG